MKEDVKSEIARLHSAIVAGGGLRLSSEIEVTGELIASLRSIVPQDVDGRPIFKDFNASGAIFRDAVDLSNIHFTGTHLGLSGIQCTHDLRMTEAIIDGSLELSNCRVDGEFRLDDAIIRGDVGATKGVFGGDLVLDEVHIEGSCNLASATFTRGLSARNMRVHGDLDLERTQWAAMPRHVGPILVKGAITLTGSTFKARTDLTLAADTLRMSAALYEGGGTLRIRSRHVDLAGFAAGAPVLLSGAWRPSDHGDVSDETDIIAGGTTVVTSFADANLGNVTLHHIDCSTATLTGALGLERLRVDSSVIFRRTHGPFARREILADELTVRQFDRSHPAIPIKELRQKRLEVAELYRALRRSREDSKNEPGARDFYYGEMTMRRRAADSAADRLMLTLYWVTSGYGTRAWRPLLILALMLTANTVLMTKFGFDNTPRETQIIDRIRLDGSVEYLQKPAPTIGYLDGARFSLEAATSLLRNTSTTTLTDTGRWLELAMRLLAPTLLALALWAFSSRLRR